MALVILPYPSMDFVPLDVLTADELDQIVANINAINGATIATANVADSAITTAKIAGGSITEAKLDRSSFASPSTNSSSLASASVPTTWTNKLSIDVSAIPTGAKFVVITTIWWRASDATPAVATRTAYNSIYGYTTYSHQAASETLISSTTYYVYTKIAGQNTAYIQWTTGTAFTITDGLMSAIAFC